MNDGKTLRAWWHDPVDYLWLVRMLAERRALAPLRILIGAGGAAIAILGAVIAGTPIGPPGDPGVASAFGVISGVLWTLRWWLRPWPSKTESLLLIGFADILFTIEFLQVPDRLFGAMGAMLLVVTGSYLSFFHSARVLALHTAWSFLSVVLFSARIVTSGGDVRLALAVALLLLAGVVAALPALQFLYWLLRTESLSDPLTALLNRRGLEIRLPHLVARYPAVSVMTLDLDRFKSVNDTWGHRVGDSVLVRTARRLQDTAASTALVARTGGEEFVVAAPIPAAAARAAAERLRSAVAATTDTAVEVTASVGVAVFDATICPECPRPTPERLLQSADAAMYRAKQSGGNLVEVDELTPPRDHHHPVPG
ncbi:GGDEF domain-containing protein [Nocardia bovistercoris]|uniref:GGDEF domain-containing protein n=1 Tax=Nocardia bovistercoris TaxID=2785916 RepID=A0A931IDX5_9NOCA|nr:GGDEF domain-containing protein [Nocardia bovistercoris]MBH0778753.1 GGDEF domain-containing protein [Nocardia bovistercoris]